VSGRAHTQHAESFGVSGTHNLSATKDKGGGLIAARCCELLFMPPNLPDLNPERTFS
jgi:hypothetical protein